jgi:hypothetical protein
LPLAGADAGTERVAAACGPRLGSKVALSTSPGAVAIFGRPVCWWAGGVGRFEIRLVVAPG